MFKAVGKHSQCQGLHTSDRLGSRRSVGQGAVKFANLSDPTTVLFLLDLKTQRMVGEHHAEAFEGVE